jgi:hypothetical protein
MTRIFIWTFPLTLALCLATLALAAVQIEPIAPPFFPIEGNSIPARLTSNALGMPRANIRLSGRDLFLFNGRGMVSPRDMSLTGLENLNFPPISILNYHFQLAFWDERDKALIQDIVPDIYQHMELTGEGPHPLGLNFTPGTPYVLILQQSYWEPNLFARSGTFNKEFNGRWVSFGIETKTSVSAVRDEIYLEVLLKNRRRAPLRLTVIPQQSAPAPDVPRAAAGASSRTSHSSAFTLASNRIQTTVVSDLPAHAGRGWPWEIPGGTEKIARFAIILQRAGEPLPALDTPDLAQRMEEAAQAIKTRLRWAAERLPTISTADQAFNHLYSRCILSVLESRWERKNFVVQPFYSVGTWTSTIAWDTSYASEMLAVLDPAGLRQALLEYIRAGLLANSWVPWNGYPAHYWYVQTPFAEMRVLTDYMAQTGDTHILDAKVNGSTVFETMKRVGEEIHQRYAHPDGLLDFGAGSRLFLEIRTDGYQHAVAADNGLAEAYFRQIAAWCHLRSDPDAARFDRWAEELQRAINKKLWNQQIGWFENLYPDGSLHLVWSYHLYDLLGSGVLTEEQQQRMISHLEEGEFLGPYGMYSISKSDHVHWDLEDVDWGGGGQYTGMPLRIAESLYRLGYSELGWDILARCARWTNSYPYIPQEIFADSGNYPKVEMPIEIAAGSGAQAILFGVFGLRPHADGSLEVSPAYHHELGKAVMSGYRFHGPSYGVAMDPWKFRVYQDSRLIAQHPYGQPVEIPPSLREK